MVEHKVEAASIKTALDEAKRILLIGHKKPDGDTLGSVCAWLELLKARGKEVEGFCLDEVPRSLAHLPGSQHVTNDIKIFDRTFDVIMVNDSGDLEYAGVDKLLEKRDNSGTTLINIDHHATNPNYGDLNLVVPTAGSNTEILTRLFLHWGEEVTKPMADNLLHGIISDTDSFSNPATTYRSLVVASELVRSGADLHDLVRRILHRKSVDELKLWGLVLSRIKRNGEFGIISSYITHDELTKFGLTMQSVHGLPNYLSLIPDANVVLVFVALPDGYIKGSLRTTRPHIDVGNLALRFGGGGHTKASGFRVKGSLKVDGDNWTII